MIDHATPTRRTTYTGRTTSWPMVAATSAGAILIVIMGTTGSEGPGMLALLAALVVLGILAEVVTASSVRASAGPNGVDLRWGIIGWPRCRYHLQDIAKAEVIDLPWYRVSFGFWWTPRRTNCTVRSGPSLRLVLVGGRLVTLTVPEPALAVRAIEDARALGDEPQR